MRNILAGVLGSFLLTSPSFADDSCADILSGIYDFRQETLNIDSAESFVNWECEAVERNGTLAGALSIPDVVEARLGGTTENLRQMCAQVESDRRIELSTSQYFRTVNGTVADAWQVCMSMRGLKASLILGADPQQFEIVLRFVPTADGVSTASLLDGEEGFRIEGNASCSSPWDSDSDRMIETGDRIFLCRRENEYERIQIAITADTAILFGNGVMVVPEYRDPPAPPDARERIAYLLEQGSTCYISYRSRSGGLGTIVGTGSYRIRYLPKSSIWRVGGPWSASGEDNTDNCVGPHPSEFAYCHWNAPFDIRPDGTAYAVEKPAIHGRMVCPE